MKVVTRDRRTERDFLHDFLAVDREFQRIAHIHVIERRDIGQHRHGNGRPAGHIVDFDILVALQQ